MRKAIEGWVTAEWTAFIAEENWLGSLREGGAVLHILASKESFIIREL